MHSSMRIMHTGAALASALALGLTAAAAQTATGQSQQQQPGAAAQGGQVQQGQTQRPRALAPSALRQQLEKSGFRNVTVLDAAYLVQANTADGDSVLMFINPPSMQAAQAGGQASGQTAERGGGQPSAAEGASTGEGAAPPEQIGVGREMRPDTKFQIPPGTGGTTTRPPQQLDQPQQQQKGQQ